MFSCKSSRGKTRVFIIGSSLLMRLLFVGRRHHFHRSGALQFQHDMKALFLIFRDFTVAPQNFFKECVIAHAWQHTAL